MIFEVYTYIIIVRIIILLQIQQCIQKIKFNKFKFNDLKSVLIDYFKSEHCMLWRRYKHVK